MTRRADAPQVVIVGAGVAGSVVAARLASRCDVVVLECGGNDDPIHHPTLAMRDTATFRTTPYPQGTGLGGGSRVNGLVFEQPPADYWESLVASGLDVFADIEREYPVVEQSAADGVVDQALLAAHPRARPALLATSSGARLTAWDRCSPERVTVRLGVEVSHVAMRGDRAIAVVTASGEEIHADEVVLCAGAIPSATIAARSALIEPVAPVLDHPGVFIPLVPNESLRGSFAGALLLEDGVMTMSVNSDVSGLLVGLMSPHSIGRLHVGSTTITVDRGLLTDARDRASLADAIRRTEVLLEHPTLVALAGASASLDVEDVSSRVGEGMWHATGTMPMGTRADSVLDGSGKLRTASNVWCMDASVFPEIPPVPPQAAVMASAGVLARRFLSLTTS
jgi:choline dehydrogenase-like flavoprotein